MLSCWDRVLILGTLPKVCFAAAMTSYLYERKVRIFDYPRFAEPFRDELRENAERLAAKAGVEIELIGKRNFRKEDRIKEVLARRSLRSGACLLGHGALLDLQAVARQIDGANLLEARRRQMPA